MGRDEIETRWSSSPDEDLVAAHPLMRECTARTLQQLRKARLKTTRWSSSPDEDQVAAHPLMRECTGRTLEQLRKARLKNYSLT